MGESRNRATSRGRTPAPASEPSSDEDEVSTPKSNKKMHISSTPATTKKPAAAADSSSKEGFGFVAVFAAAAVGLLGGIFAGPLLTGAGGAFVTISSTSSLETLQKLNAQHPTVVDQFCSSVVVVPSPPPPSPCPAVVCPTQEGCSPALSEVATTTFRTVLSDDFEGLLNACASETGCAVDARDQFGNTPLHIASSHGELKSIKVLIQYGADLNAGNGVFSRTPLMLAAANNQVEAVKLLLDNGAEIDKLDAHGRTAGLVRALRPDMPAKENLPDITCRELAARGSNFVIRDNFGLTADDLYTLTQSA